MSDSHTDIASGYFDYLARAFPVMCASDEFHFLPRVTEASQYYDRLDSLDAELIAERISMLKEFRKDFELRMTHETDLENFIDFALLRANVNGILIDLEAKQSWRHNPLLYLKIAFIGLDHALHKPASEPGERGERTAARLASIPRLLQQAGNNLDGVPRTYHGPSLAMARDCKDYLDVLGKSLVKGSEGFSVKRLESARAALDGFEKHLLSLSPKSDGQFPLPSLEATIGDHFLSTRSPREIFEIGVEEWRENRKQLFRLQRRIDPDRSWQELYHLHAPPGIEDETTLSLYRQEIQRLNAFFHQEGFPAVDSSLSLELCETPLYLRSVRSAASFSAALATEGGEKDLFYITTQPAQHVGQTSRKLLRRRLEREYKFLAAHETIPGHHLLDRVRRRLENAVRRQTESPLFYEGWAYYAESLLAEYGYVNHPVESLVDAKRRLWRAARCQIDVGLPTGRLTRNDAVELLTEAGFSRQEANNQIDRFRLNPGYQLCYSLGRHEIVRLRKTFGSRMSRNQFHRQLLEGGELPFHLMEKRLEASLTPRGTVGDSTLTESWK